MRAMDCVRRGDICVALGCSPRKQSSLPSTAPDERYPSRYDAAGVLGRMTYSFGKAMLDAGQRGTLQEEQLDELSVHDQSKSQIKGFEACWARERERHPTSPRLWRASIAHVHSSFWAAAWYNALESVTRVLQPVLLRDFLVWIQQMDAQDEVGRGIMLALGLGVLSFLQAHVHHKLYYFGMRMGFNLRVAATGAVYGKVLRLSSGSLRAATAGHAVNLVSNDVARFDSICPIVHFIWSPLLELVAVAILMSSQVGWVSALAGVASCTALVPIQMCFAKRFSVLRQRTANFTDRRVKLTGELVNGIGTVKTFGWEQPYMERVGQIRTSERHSILRTQIMRAVNLAIYFANVAIASLATFTTYWSLGNELTMPVAFSTLSYLYVLRFSLGRSFALALEFFPEIWVSLRRLETFLLLPEVRRHQVCASCPDVRDVVVREDLEHALSDASKSDTSERADGDSSSMVVANGACLAWDLASDQDGSVATFSLRELSFDIKRGQLIVVLGPVGCGKSAFLCALAGELEVKPQSGMLRNYARSLAFVAQQPWVREGSIRANVVFGRARELDPSKPAAAAEEMHDAEAYEEAIEAAALKADIKQWEDGERTLVGEKGVTLSGGQKARVALARAVYARADQVLLDDPLSAVDPAVARHIFEHGIRDVLLRRHGATVFLATHQQQYASSECVDMVLLLNEHGQQVACAPYSQLQQQGLLQQHVDGTQDVSDDDDNGAHAEDSVLAADSDAKKPRQVIANEDRVMGQVTRTTYCEYFRAGGSYWALAVLMQFVGAQVTLMAADYWLLRWTMYGNDDRDWYWPGIFIGLCSGCVVLGFSRAFSFFVFTSWAGANLHRRMLSGVFYAPMAFFHANPSGRILNKFSADQGQIDELLPTVLFDFLQSAAIVIGAVVLVIAAIPWLLLLLIPLAWLFVGVRHRFLASARELKRLDAISRSPIFSEFSATLGGLQTVRAYGAETLCRQRFSELLDANGRCWYAHLIASRWLGFNLDMMCVALLVVLCLGGALLRVYAPDAVDGGLVGFAIVHTLALSGIFQWAVRQSAMVESQMTSIERALFYARLQSEEDAAMDARSDSAPFHPPKNWPAHGHVQMRGVEVRYGDGMPHVLKGIDVDWHAGARVGVLGRTGSGKSTLVHALLRLNEVVGGKIEIDGVDITRMSLNDLRREGTLCLIPQEPCLFSGTLRSNLDPFCTKTDEELWAAIRAVQLDQAVRSNGGSGGLDAEVCEGGANFSVGERQLISLARAILRGSRVFITDEATANVDFDTDTLVQRMLRESDIFRDRTVVQIAHRMHTIIDSDLLILLDNGRVVETGAPAELLSTPGSLFSSMVKETGNAAELRARAKAATRAQAQDSES